jgi:hypothetical protein
MLKVFVGKLFAHGLGASQQRLQPEGPMLIQCDMIQCLMRREANKGTSATGRNHLSAEPWVGYHATSRTGEKSTGHARQGEIKMQAAASRRAG